MVTLGNCFSDVLRYPINQHCAIAVSAPNINQFHNRLIYASGTSTNRAALVGKIGVCSASSWKGAQRSSIRG